jgi:TonB family protein
MRKQAWFLILLGIFTTLSVGAEATAQSLGARSAHHELRIERSVVAPDQIAYDVRVIDLDGGAVALSSRVAGRPGEAVDAKAVSGDQQIHVRLAYTPNFFSATLNVVRGETILDEFRTWWQLEPRTAGQTSGAVQRLPLAGAYYVGVDVKAPVVVKRVDPQYTEQARLDRISGIAIVEVRVGKDGQVKDAIVLKPLPGGLSEAALDAVRQWQFKPGTLDSEPVDVIFSLTVNFKLDTQPPPRP